ncbi:GNAT family N-acetyltransferase [Shewanella sp. Isolate11]|uniref:GNAT family N-acetyltransferase n=1 Tax=Shewanella sp. Isolate11 TaxID=2908530 RepID=UPI001EFE3E74|nr:GNAT family N-acetyltransferase [Shewanella sp. Isolate11]MCG9695853.1 GNAT family N-acetyltransferase [Shewanella sp. Isolate11]
MIIRHIQPNDWPAILSIQQECYPEIAHETQAALESKVKVSADSCYVVEVNAQVVGYCLAHPWVINQPPSLEQQIDAMNSPDTLYLHDIALSAKARGLKAGEKIFNLLKQKTKQFNFDSISLVAVEGADTYWQRLGFKSRIIDKSLDNYPADACYMVYQLGQ